MNLFLDVDEDINDIVESNNDIVLERSNKFGRKRLIGGPSEETFLILYYDLHTFSDFITHFLTEKGLCVLPGRLNNYPIEKRFSLNKNLSGNHLSLDLSSFSRYECTFLLNLINELYQHFYSIYNEHLCK